MIIRIGCEESGTVGGAFAKLGYDVETCDLQPTRGMGRHCQGDVVEWLSEHEDKSIDLLGLHLDCTTVAVSGNRWYGEGMPKHQERLDYIKWAASVWELGKQKAKRAYLENPVSVLFKHLEFDQLQYIQPWQFGHGETKKTGLALFNLPVLSPTNIVEGREQRVWKMPPGPNRKRDRSKTYQGVADAMAAQWGIALSTDKEDR